MNGTPQDFIALINFLIKMLKRAGFPEKVISLLLCVLMLQNSKHFPFIYKCRSSTDRYPLNGKTFETLLVPLIADNFGIEEEFVVAFINGFGESTEQV